MEGQEAASASSRPGSGRAQIPVRELVRGGIGTGLVKVLHVGVGAAASILLARLLGPEGYGQYALVFVVVSGLSILAQRGQPTLIVREIARAQAVADSGAAQAFTGWSFRLVLGSSFLVTLIALGVSFLLQGVLTRSLGEALGWGLLALPFFTLTRWLVGALRGHGKVVTAQLVDPIMLRLLLLFAALVFLSIAPDQSASTGTALLAGASVITLLIGASLWFRASTSSEPPRAATSAEKVSWARASWPLLASAVLLFVNQRVDILVLSAFRPDQEVGLYQAAVTLALLMVMGQSMLALVIGPQLARLHALQEQRALQRVVAYGALTSGGLAVPLFLLCTVFGRPTLALTFGPEFADAALPLAVLATGQLVNAFTGTVSLLLNMTGHEREVFRVVGIAAGVNLLLNFLLVPWLGLLGAAFSSAATSILWCLILRQRALRKLGIEAFPLPRSFTS